MENRTLLWRLGKPEPLLTKASVALKLLEKELKIGSHNERKSPDGRMEEGGGKVGRGADAPENGLKNSEYSRRDFGGIFRHFPLVFQ